MVRFLARELQRLEMHLSDQRASRVDHFQRAVLRFLAHRGRHAVGAEHQHRAVRHVLDGLHKNRPAAAQLLHHVGVMHDFVMDVDRGAVRFQRQLHDIHRSHHSRAEAPRPYPQQYLSICRSLHRYPK
jgi:hypothetical protein